MSKCECGCGRTTRRIFAPGHDSILASDLTTQVVLGGITKRQATIRAAKVSGLFRAKVAGQIDRARARTLVL